jgi:hypothetical protein
MNRTTLLARLKRLGTESDDVMTEGALIVISALYTALVNGKPELIEKLRVIAEGAGEAAAPVAQQEVDQTSEQFEDFAEPERTLPGSFVAIQGKEVPILTAMGSGMTTIHGIRRRDGQVEFGIGDKDGPIVNWLTAKQFCPEVQD